MKTVLKTSLYFSAKIFDLAFNEVNNWFQITVKRKCLEAKPEDLFGRRSDSPHLAPEDFSHKWTFHGAEMDLVLMTRRICNLNSLV